MEIGSDFPAGRSRRVPFSSNFDVIAHQLGHLIIYSEIGLPAEGALDGEYFGFHEAAADLTALDRHDAFRQRCSIICSRRRTAISTPSMSSIASPSCRRTRRSGSPATISSCQTFRAGLARRAQAVGAAHWRDFRHSGRYLRREPARSGVLDQPGGRGPVRPVRTVPGIRRRHPVVVRRCLPGPGAKGSEKR